MAGAAVVTRSPVVALRWMLLAGCCAAGAVAASLNGTSLDSLLTVLPSAADVKPTVSHLPDNGCTSDQLFSFGTIAEQWSPSAVAIDFAGRSAYAFDPADGSIVEKQLVAGGVDGGVGWRRLGGGSEPLRGVVGMVRGVALPPSAGQQLPPPALLVTTSASHCVRGVAIDAARAAYTTYRYLGSCSVSGDLDGSVSIGTFASPQHLALTRASDMLYVVEPEALRSINVSASHLGTVLPLIRAARFTTVGAYLSPDEGRLFLPLRDGSIAQVDLRRKVMSTTLRMAAGNSLGLSPTLTVALAWTGAAAATLATTPCATAADHYLLAARGALAAAVPSGPGQLNVTWVMAERVLAGAAYSDGRSLLVIAARNVTAGQPAAGGGTEYLLLTPHGLSTPRGYSLVSDGPAISTASSVPPATTSVGDIAVATVLTMVPSVASGSPVAPAAGDPSPSGLSGGSGADHGDVVVLASSLTAASVGCACLLATAAVLLARRLCRSPWNRRTNVKQGPQDDYIILVTPGGDPGGVDNGGCSASTAAAPQPPPQPSSHADRGPAAATA